MAKVHHILELLAYIRERHCMGKHRMVCVSIVSYKLDDSLYIHGSHCIGKIKISNVLDLKFGLQCQVWKAKKT